MRTVIAVAMLVLLLAACGGRKRDSNEERVAATATLPATTAPQMDATDSAATVAPLEATVDPATAQNAGGMGMGRRMGGAVTNGQMDPDMRARHQAPVPAAYAGLLNPTATDEASLARGKAAYVLYCTACHGESGRGDGPAAAALNPAPPQIAVTSRMMGDDYLFWRISEGGTFAPFNSTMPPWKSAIDEATRWDIINYMRSLSGRVGRGAGPGMDGDMEQAMRAQMLAAGREQGVITEPEAALFDTVHNRIDARLAANPDRRWTGTMSEIQSQLLEELVESGEVSREDAAAFDEIHARLLDGGLMQ